MIHWRFRAPLVAAALAGGLVIAGCSSGGGSGLTAPGNLEKTNLTVAAVPALDSAALYIAQQRGYFADEGLHVTILPAISSKTVIAQQAAGKLDVTVGNYVSYILAQVNKQADLQIIAPGSVMQPNTQEILVPANSPIQTVSQLQGKTVGVNVTGNIGTLLVESVLADSAINNVTQAVHFKAVPFPKMSAELRNHQLDAAWLPEPFVTQAEEQAGAMPLADADQGASQNIPVTGYVVTKAWAKKYPHTLAAFRAAILKAQAVAAAHPGAVQSGMEKFAGTSAQDAAIAAAPQYPTQNSQALIQRLAALMLNFGMLNQKFDVSTMFPKSG
jgi:NitT/TauT family transport system substrate-binding protein